MFSNSQTATPSASTKAGSLDRFHERWRRILSCLQGAVDESPASSGDDVRDVVAQMAAFGDDPLPCRATHGVLLHAACIAEQTRKSSKPAVRPPPVRATHRDRVLNLHQALTTALDHSSTVNLNAVAEALQAMQSIDRHRQDLSESEWTELHCEALARQLVRLLGSTAPAWLRRYTRT